MSSETLGSLSIELFDHVQIRDVLLDEGHQRLKQNIHVQA